MLSISDDITYLDESADGNHCDANYVCALRNMRRKKAFIKYALVGCTIAILIHVHTVNVLHLMQWHDLFKLLLSL